VLEEFTEKLSGEGKVAIDLGCGNSASAMRLLRKGWKVIAVDSSKEALTVLEKTIREENSAWLRTEKVEMFLEDITTFTPCEPADLVIACDVLPYIDPMKFQETWLKIQKIFVKKNGLFIGTLFHSINNPVMPFMKEQGAWFLPDRRMVKPLLMEAGYVIEDCRYRFDLSGREQMVIQFVGRKT
jgi:cyclopropane fatty-acyl-phospholipid synthase-like methyltransferase